MDQVPTLDAHAHIRPNRSTDELVGTGSVLAMTLTIEEGALGVQRCDPQIAWGVGCHPRLLTAQRTFQVDWFARLIEKTAVVGEIGLDSGSRVPMETQLRNFRQILDRVAGLPRIVSIHSYQATRLVLEELSRQPIVAPILHWWTGSAAETKQAVALGCYFSIHSQVARQSRFRSWVPPERILLESDHGYEDPPPAIPLRIGWVEYLVAQQYKLDVKAVRRRVWSNLGEIVHQTGTSNLLPISFMELIRNPS